jgi:hypothetical protein
MLRKTILNLAFPLLLLLALALPSWGKDDSVTPVPFKGTADTEAAPKENNIALLPMTSSVDAEGTQGGSQGVDCFYEQNLYHPDCTGRAK